MQVSNHFRASPFHYGRIGGAHFNAFNHGQNHNPRRGAVETELALVRKTTEVHAKDGRTAYSAVASQSSLSLEQSGFDSRRDLIHSAKRLMRKAFGGLARDFGQALEAMGLGEGGVKGLMKGLMKSMAQAVRSGTDFTAQLSLAAIEKTSLTSASGTAESFSLIARSIEISINHDTGELKFDVQNVQIERDRTTTVQPLPPPPPPPEAEVEQETPEVAALSDLEKAIETKVAESENPDTPEAGPVVLALPNVDTVADEHRFESLRTALSIHSAMRYRNEDGERITQLFVDARIALSRIMDSEPEATAELAAMEFQAGLRLNIRA